MKKYKGILFFILSIFVWSFLILKPAIPQDSEAGLLPNAVQQFFDNNGNPLSSGKVYFYEVGTTTFKDTYTSSEATTTNSNPITLNAGGKASTGGIYGIGLYRQLVKDRNGNTIWDAVTSPTGSGGSTPTEVGDGNLVGTILPWSGLIAPNQYLFAYGQEIDRTDYPEFFTAITLQSNVICSASNNTLTGLADTTQIPVGAAIELSLCVPAGTTVVSKTTSSVTLSNPSSVSINAVAVFFPYGNGDGSITFNVPDLRDVVLAGRPNMGGGDRGLLTTAYYGVDPLGLGVLGGTESTTISQVNLPNVNFILSATANGGSATLKTDVLIQSGSTGLGAGANPGQIPSSSTYGSNQGTLTTNFVQPTITGTAASGGSGTPISRIQPTLTMNYIIKVTPDTSTSIATGVYSIGGMTGVISCGTGILCTGNIISFNGSVLAGGNVNSVQFKNSVLGEFGGSDGLLFISPNNLTLGLVGSSGIFDIYGSTSGRVRQTVQTTAGTPTITWGDTSGTPAVNATAPLSLNTTTGNISCPTCATSTLNGQALTKVDDTNVTLTLGGAASTALLSPASLTLGWTGTLAAARLNSNVVQAVTNDTNVTGSITAQNLTLNWSGQLAVGKGGTGLSAGVSGGIPYFNSISTMASSALLGANQLMIGGGAGGSPSTITCATTTTVVHGGTPPTCSQIVSADITTNTITNSNLSQVSARTIKGNPTGSTTDLQDVLPATARSSNLLNIDQLTNNGDSNYNILNTDRSVFTSASLTTARTWTLPAANTVNAGQEITIWDAAGGIISPNNLTVDVTGGDTINGASSVTISTQYGGITLKSDGVSKYTYVPQASGGGGGGSGTVTNVSTAGIITGGPITTTGTIGINATIVPQGRLTLTTATPVLTSSVSTATTVYYTPYIGNLVPIYNGAVFTPTAFAEVSQATTDTTKSPAAVANNSNYDIFCWSDSGTNRCTRGPAWSTDTSRGSGGGTTELIRVNGIWLNANNITNGPSAQRGTYVGTIRSNGSSTIDYIFGTAAVGGGASFLYVWNAYNKVGITSRVAESTDTWTYNSSTWRPLNNSNSNRISFIDGLGEEAIKVSASVFSSQSGSSYSSTAIGLDSTNTNWTTNGLYIPTITGVTSNVGGLIRYGGLTGIGYHYFQQLEQSTNGLSTFFGDNGNASQFQTGIMIEMRN